VWEKINATARMRQVVVVIQKRPGGKRLPRKHDRCYTTNDVTCTKLAIFPAGTISFDHAAGWNDNVDRNGISDNTFTASTIHSHTWTCDEDGHLVHLMITVLASCGDTMACSTSGTCASSCFARLVSQRQLLTTFRPVTCANWHSCSEEQVAGAWVIQRMDQCDSSQVGICDLTGLCKLMIANFAMASSALDARFTAANVAARGCSQERAQGSISETHTVSTRFC